MDREVIEDDDSPGTQRGDQDLLQLVEEGPIVDRAVEYCRGTETVEPERGDDRVGRAWVDALKQRRRETGSIKPRRQTKFRERVLAGQEDRLTALITARPDATVHGDNVVLPR